MQTCLLTKVAPHSAAEAVPGGAILAHSHESQAGAQPLADPCQSITLSGALGLGFGQCDCQC